MNTILLTYAAYVIISVTMTIWVARTLHGNGLIFLIDAFGGNKEMAASVNHLLVVGFYLVNLGFILLFLKLGAHPGTIVEGVEYLASKLGVVMLVLGAMHFFNMFNFHKMRRKGVAKFGPTPPALPVTR